MVVNTDSILLLIVGLTLGSALVVFLLIVSIKFYFIERDKHIKQLTNVLEDCLVDFLLHENEIADRAFARIQKLMKSKTNQNITIELLLNLNHNFSGVYAEKAYDLYEALALQEVSMAKLKSRKWHQKIRGMYELSTLEYEEAFDAIAAYINHPNDDVKRNARVSLVKIKRKEALIALKDLEGSMSLWTFINIIATLKRNPVKLSELELSSLKEAKNTYIKELANELETTVYVQ
ncbi:hypothetical protein SAMN05216474_0316 [Lishizhenia tianjinensis]|uniref:HEAT repeat-containing protein n=1 Tax=Lishizhenia tianjinensis TaxID=477690 RepID=A0A1I6XMU7_9FLAO|nr:HEAT repeat domain-containing protein [Lishizhenia tianjinensis]SFT39496.1 hypothetical protein SAMN05216474_0316 [Lishizhenia tianjinensis]